MNCFGLDSGCLVRPFALEPGSVLALQPVSLSAVAVPGSGLASATAVIATVAAAKEFG